MPSVGHEQNASSPNAGSPNNGGASPVAVVASMSSLEEELLSSVKCAPTNATTGVVDDEEYGVNAPPKSWSFAARQRLECARIVRIFRYARLRMRQTLRGLALDHAELLLGAVTRTVVEVAGGGGEEDKLPAGGPARGKIQQQRPQARDGAGCNEGESDHREPSGDLEPQLGHPRHFDLGGLEEENNKVSSKDKQRVRRRSNPRHEARHCDAWNTRLATDVDEKDMGDLSTLALDTSGLEEIPRGGLGARVAERERLVVEWRKAFRKKVVLTGGRRYPAHRCAIWRY